MKFKVILIIFSLLILFKSSAQFGPVNEISKSVSAPIDSKAVDLDNDGDLDILSASRDDNKVCWYENLGNGLFGIQKVISINNIGINCVQAADIDNDGDLDVISAAKTVNKIVWYENLGQGLFGTENIITGSVSALSFEVKDIDNDGDVDVIAGDIDNNKIVWFENLGNGSFGPILNIFNSVSFPYTIHAEDLDNDGDLDILSTSYLLNKILWFENLGNGNFIFVQEVYFGATLPRSISTEDIDNDGDMDIFSTSTQGDVVFWHENVGGTFTSHTIGFVDGASEVNVADIDGDGDLDIVYSGFNDDIVKWRKNEGNGSFAAAETITALVNGPESLFIADIDGDGDQDVLISSVYDHDIAWYENTGGVWNEHFVSNNYLKPMDVDFDDIDGDGLKDVVCVFAIDGTIGWYKNLGNNIYATDIQIIFNSSYPSSPSAFISASDIDNDGDVDIISATSGGNEIIWFENTGNGTFGPKQIIYQNPIEAVGINIVDVNNDGLLDIVSTDASSSNNIIWFVNMGSGSFSSGNVIPLNNGIIYSITLKDLDLDGDVDILTTHFYTNKVLWIENLGGNNFGTEQPISTTIDRPLYAIAVDLDGDLDNDIICSSWGDSIIVWYENIGSGLFGPEQLLTNTSHPVKELYLEDIDSDGDFDLLTANSADQFIGWYENTGSGLFNNQNVIVTNELVPRGMQVTDMDEDGDLDLLYCTYGINRIAWNENFFSSKYKLNGDIFYDLNEDGIKSNNEGPLDLFSVFLSPTGQASYTNADGSYFFSTDTGSYTVNYVLDSLWVLTTDSTSYTRVLSNLNPVCDSLNFGFHPDTLLTAISTELIGGFPRCNSIINYWINYNNMGTTLPSGLIHLELDDSILYISSEVTPDSIVGQNIYWHFDSLYYYQHASIQIQVATPNFMNIGDTVKSTLTIVEIDTIGIIDNLFLDSLSQVIVCAYDPNDKTVSPRGLGSQGFVGENQVFEYLIRFQNTGNDTAITVVIRDQLDSDLDWSSFEFIASSHPLQTWIEQDGEVVFRFNNIMLPDSNVNEIESHGFISYKITAKENLPPNTQITNIGHIYFDINPPVITNTVLNTIYDCNTLYFTSSIPTICSNSELLIYYENDGFSDYNWMIDSIYSENSNNLMWLPDTTGLFNIKLTISNSICTKDSIQSLMINDIYVNNQSLSICEKDSVLLAGQYQSYPGVYYDTLQTETGCDSICVTNLNVNNLTSINLLPFNDDTVCLNTGNLSLPNGIPVGGTYSINGIVLSQLNTINLGEGIHEIVYSISDTNNCINSDTTLIYIVDCTGISQNEDFKIIIYPNPSSGIYILELPFEFSNEMEIEIYDINSKLIKKRITLNNENIIHLDLEGINDGIYYVHIINNKKTYIRKLIKIKE